MITELSSDEISFGLRLGKKINDELSADILFWERSLETLRWKLVVGSQDVAKKGILFAYRRVAPILSDYSFFDIADLDMRSSNEGICAELRNRFESELHSSESPNSDGLKHATVQSESGEEIEALVYWVVRPVSKSVQKRIDREVRLNRKYDL